jgi:tetratricopeptide (TPR) repeat protein
MKKVGEKYLPRFIYLKAKSWEQIGNYVNSVICFNQLIKMKPNISEYYLERGIIYHRIGYYKEAKEDFVTFGILKPNAQQYIKEKVLCEKN